MYQHSTRNNIIIGLITLALLSMAVLGVSHSVIVTVRFFFGVASIITGFYFIGKTPGPMTIVGMLIVLMGLFLFGAFGY